MSSPPSFSSRTAFWGWAAITLSVAVIGAFATLKIRDRTDPDCQRLQGIIETEANSRREAQAQAREATNEAVKEKQGRQAAEREFSTASAAVKISEKRIKDLEQQVEAERVAKTAIEGRLLRESSLRQEAEERNRTREETRPAGTPVQKDDTAINTPVVKRSDDPSARPETSPVSPSASRRESFDLGDIVATAEWARLNENELEVSFTFTNKTKNTLWIVPASQDTAQATDNVKNSYKWIGATGFRRKTDRLWPEPRMLANDFLQLDPNVSAPGSFLFRRNSRGAAYGASKIRFFTGLTIIRDFKARSAYDRTVTAEINLN